MLVPRDYQMTLIDGTGQAFRQGALAVLIVAPTGAGKTIIIAWLVFRIVKARKKVGVFAHRRELIKQASQKLTLNGIEHSLCMPGAVMGRSAVIVGSVQTARRRLHQAIMQDFDYLIFDEAHHAIAGDYMAIMKANPTARVIGPTATPEREDGRGLGKSCGGIFDVMIQGPTVAGLMKAGWLVEARVYGPGEHEPDMSAAQMRGDDFDISSLEAVMEAPGITGNAVAEYRELCPGQPGISFCTTVKHAHDVAATFRADGWQWVAVDGSTKDRGKIFDDLENGRIHGISACSLISEGLDIPNVSVAIGLRPSASLALVLQQWGRVLRPLGGTAGDLAAIAASSKPFATILDHAGNSSQRGHGLPETERDWTLEGRRGKEKATIDLRQCPKCFLTAAPRRVCKGCGHEFAPAVVEGEARQLAIHTDDRRLELMTADRIAEIRNTPLKDLVKKARTKDDFQEIAEAKGYRPNWIAHAMEERARAAERHRSGGRR